MSTDSWIGPAAEDISGSVRIRGLGVDYGTIKALGAVDLTIPTGEVFGLLGPNGAGKTTLFRVLSTLLQPTCGDAFLCGMSTRSDLERIRGILAYMPDLAPLPSDLRAREYLTLFAGAYGLRGKLREERVLESLETVGLRDRSNDICTKLSLGMRQRLALAKALLHRPKILILDEPASGLDPAARAEMKLALRHQAERGATVILSSHVMSEIQQLCTSIGLLKRGQLLDAGPIRKVLARFAGPDIRLLVRVPGNRNQAALWLARQPGVCVASKFPDDESVEVRIDPEQVAPAELFTALGGAGLGVVGMHAIETSVEEVVVGLGVDAPLS